MTFERLMRCTTTFVGGTCNGGLLIFIKLVGIGGPLGGIAATGGLATCGASFVLAGKAGIAGMGGKLCGVAAFDCCNGAGGIDVSDGASGGCDVTTLVLFAASCIGAVSGCGNGGLIALKMGSGSGVAAVGAG